MRRTLLTLLKDVNVRDLRQKRLFSFLIFCLMSISVMAQAPSTGTIDDCTCLQNSEDPDLSQFSESIIITSSSTDVWTVVSATDFYMIGSPAPPAAPTPFAAGYVIPHFNNDPSSPTFRLDGIRTPNTAWSVTISDGTDQFVLNATHTCTNPTPQIFGDMGNCVETIKEYYIDVQNVNLIDALWTITGDGTITGGQGTNMIEVTWGTTPGVHTVSFSGHVRSFDGQDDADVAESCELILDLDVDVMDETAIPLACNNTVNLSLNNSCQLSVVADMILEDMMLTNASYNIILRDIEADTIVPNDIIPIDYINKTLEATVVHECSGNSCWGYIHLEDKSIPQLVCPDDMVLDCNEVTDPSNTGFPLPLGITPVYLGDDKWLVESLDPCSDVILEYYDQVDANLCSGPYSSVITRSWKITDTSGNSSTCSHSISINRTVLADLTMPENYDDALGPNPSIEACSDYEKLDNGHPSPEHTGYPIGIICMNVHMEYTDTKLPKCGDQTFKIRRRWHITDLCTNDEIVHNQYITVMDNEPPVCAAPEEFTTGTDPLTCGASFDVPPPIVIFECSEYDYYVSYKIRQEGGDPFTDPLTDGVVRNSDDTYTITNVPSGQDSVWIIYTLEDVCGNVSQCFTEVAIEDDEEPIAVCDLHTFVAVNEDGWAIADIESFDDGSWDNCMIDYMEVRRMGSNPCGSNTWDDHAKFCCSDIGNVVMVEMRVWDKKGHSNSCMVEVEVQDNMDPIITCPANRDIDCRSDYSNLSVFGSATMEDNCSGTITETSTEFIGDCGEGSIRRTFTVTDTGGNTDQCTQVITIENQSPFRESNITWPRDHTVTNGCLDSGVDPDDLPNGRQRPVLNANICSNVAAEYEDLVFQVVDGACFKILRTWTVIDWCQFNPFVPDEGRWTHTQVIKVLNNSAPVFTQGCSADDITVTSLNACNAQIDITAEAEDDCSGASSLIWTYTIDYDNDGSINATGSSNSISRVVSFGTHKITWYVRDECDNERTCSFVFGIDDTKKPTPYCLSEIATVVMETTGTVSIWASDFDNGSYDNCTDTDDIRMAFSSNPSNTSMTFDCDDLNGESTEIELDIYAIDLKGNYDYCTVVIRIQDNNNVCGGQTSQKVTVAGRITTENNEALANTNVLLHSQQPEYPKLSLTDAEGHYAFSDLEMYNDYSVISDMQDDHMNGVSTLDIVLIQRHILGLSKFDSPYKVIAADVNGSESVSASDLVVLRKLILGLNSELPEGLSWKFVDAHQEFNDVNDPFPIQTAMSMGALDHDAMETDFIGVKLGDVNDSKELDNIKSKDDNSTRSVKSLVVDDVKADKGDLFEVSISSEDISDIIGLQFSINTSSEVEIIEIKSDVLDIDESNYAINISDGISTFSWNNSQKVNISEEVLTLVLKANNDIEYIKDHLKINSQLVEQELYTLENDDLRTYDLIVEYRLGDIVSSPFELYQNVPNPFDKSTSIGFNLPESSDINLQVYSYTGKLIYEHKGSYAKGYNEVTLNTSDINATGILYYQLNSDKYSASRKMIVIK